MMAPDRKTPKHVWSGRPKSKKVHSPLNYPNQRKVRPLTIKEIATVDNLLQGKTQTETGVLVFNASSPKNAERCVAAVLKRPEVKDYMQKRYAALGLSTDKYLLNLDKLADEAKKEDVRLRANQDLLDRAGEHQKYHDTERPDDDDISDDAIANILSRYQPLD